MPYTFITQAQFTAALAQRLYDATNQLYPTAELIAYQTEALQAFNAFANFYRQEFVFASTAGVTWYDLTTQTNTLRALTATDQSLINLIEYHFLEPQTATYPLTWTGSKQFTITDLLNAIQQVRDQVLSETNCTVVESLVAATPGRTFLSDNAIQLRRVCWLPVASPPFAANCLLPSDVWGAQSFEAGYPQLGNGTPQMYMRSAEPPLSFDVDIQPAVNGQYDVLTVNAGPALSATAATVLNVPNDWCWIIKYGAIQQLLEHDSIAQDATRARYAAMRYKQGVAAMQEAPALIAARIDNVPVVIEAVTSGDYYDANWQGKVAGQPTSIYYSGLNLIALSPQPNAGPYSITASVVRNMVLPSIDSDFLQIGRDDIQAVLDYAQHIAMIKIGGAEFAATLPLFQNFMRHCALYNSKLKALSPFLDEIDLRSKRDMQESPVFSKVTPETIANG
jgi:hypothetical protein